MLKVRFPVLALLGLSVLAVSPSVSLAAEEIYFTEDFSTDPAGRGWQAYGNTNLFHWSAASQNMEATWDSSQPNSIFCHALGSALDKSKDFILGFDLRLSSVTIGTNPEKPYTFELAVGLTDLASVTNAGFLRGTGFNSPNLVEFDYFPDSGYGATISTPIISSNNGWASGGFTYPMTVTTGDVYHVEMRYSAASQTLRTYITRNGEAFGPLEDTRLGATFSDFRVDQMAISSYSDEGQDPEFSGSLLASGTVDNFLFISPPPVGEVTGCVVNEAWQVQFLSHTNWLYSLQRTDDFQNWLSVSGTLAGNGASLTLSDPSPPAGKAFYRVQATRQ